MRENSSNRHHYPDDEHHNYNDHHHHNHNNHRRTSYDYQDGAAKSRSTSSTNHSSSREQSSRSHSHSNAMQSQSQSQTSRPNLFRPELSVSLVARIPRAWTDSQLKDCLNFRLLPKGNQLTPVVHCQRNHHRNNNSIRNHSTTDKEEYYVELRTENYREMLLKLNDTNFMSGSVVICPHIEPWERQQRRSESPREPVSHSSMHRKPNINGSNFNSNSSIDTSTEDHDHDDASERSYKRSKTSMTSYKNALSSSTYSSLGDKDNSNMNGGDGNTNGSEYDAYQSKKRSLPTATVAAATTRGKSANTTDTTSSYPQTSDYTNHKLFLTKAPDGYTPESFQNYLNRLLVAKNLHTHNDDGGDKQPILECYRNTTSSNRVDCDWILTARTRNISDSIIITISDKLVLSGTQLCFQRHLYSSEINSSHSNSRSLMLMKPQTTPTSTILPTWKDEHCCVYLSRKPESMSWYVMGAYINNMIQKCTTLFADMYAVIDAVGFKSGTCRMLCSSAVAAQFVVDKLDGKMLKGVRLQFRRHRSIIRQQEQQQKQQHYPIVEGTNNNSSTDKTANTTLTTTRKTPPLPSPSPMSPTTALTTTTTNKQLSIRNNMDTTTTASNSETISAATKTNASRFLYCRAASTTKPIPLDKVSSFLNKAVIDGRYCDHNVIVGTKACGPFLHRLETDTEDAASKLIQLSGILYDNAIELILTRTRDDDVDVDVDVNIDTLPKDLSSTTKDQDQPPVSGKEPESSSDDRKETTVDDDDDQSSAKNKEDKVSIQKNRLVFVKLALSKSHSRKAVKISHSDFESFFIRQLVKYGFDRVHGISEDSLMKRCYSVKDASLKKHNTPQMIFRMATPQLASALMNFNCIHYYPWTVFLSRHSSYKGPPPRFESLQAFILAYRLNPIQATRIQEIKEQGVVEFDFGIDTNESPRKATSTKKILPGLSENTAQAGNSDNSESLQMIKQLNAKNAKLTRDMVKLLKENKDLKRRNDGILTGKTSIVKADHGNTYDTYTPVAQNITGAGTHEEPIELGQSCDDGDSDGDGELAGSSQVVRNDDLEEMKSRYETTLSELEESKSENIRIEKELEVAQTCNHALEVQVEKAKKGNEEYERRLQEIRDAQREENLQIEEQEKTIQSFKSEVKKKQKSIDELNSKLQGFQEKYQEMTDALTRATRMYDEERETRKELTRDVVRLNKAKKLAGKNPSIRKIRVEAKAKACIENECKELESEELVTSNNKEEPSNPLGLSVGSVVVAKCAKSGYEDKLTITALNPDGTYGARDFLTQRKRRRSLQVNEIIEVED